MLRREEKIKPKEKGVQVHGYDKTTEVTEIKTKTKERRQRRKASTGVYRKSIIAG
jgi:hypothetical protein